MKINKYQLREMIRESVIGMLKEEESDRRLNNHIRRLIRESLWEESDDDFDDEDDDLSKDKKEKKKDSRKSGRKRKEVMDWLLASEDDTTTSFSLNHADIMRKLWHPEDDAEEDELRSLFSKKLHHKENDNGSIYDFTDEEINSLYNIKGNI